MSINTQSARQQSESDVRHAARDLARAVEALRRDGDDSPDLRRLVQDTQRIAEDLDLLFGPESPVTALSVTPDVIPDGDYPPGFFADAEDEGVGRHR
ncbi:hypothetical protein [Motilibacter deserti]|uniref:Uncharacterized protein n=1 Tax=Motilibacter deserti TaxID=2714956 RepID=A0ABX0GPZ3_9ACTN|nr:hypothetical protein [Motilibacter deserti]NHC12889.1 hypothetical protein [Motilibacter deserti]